MCMKSIGSYSLLLNLSHHTPPLGFICPPPWKLVFPILNMELPPPWIYICPPPLKFAAMYLPPLERNPEINPDCYIFLINPTYT
jgi:hypothetical protein